MIQRTSCGFCTAFVMLAVIELRLRGFGIEGQRRRWAPTYHGKMMMTTADQRFGAWSGMIAAGLIGIALLLPGFVPPPSPALSTEEVVAIYQSKTGAIRLGMFIGMFGIAFYPLFVGAISTQMRRMQGISRFPVYVQLGAGSISILMLLIPLMLILVAAFRPDRDPLTTVALNDMAWLFFITPFSTFLAQNIAIAIGILSDKSPRPVFPRWLAYLNIWTGLLFVPGGLAFFFKTGPFAWNGLLAFWLPAVVFFAWLIIMAVMLLKAIGESEQDAASA